MFLAQQENLKELGKVNGLLSETLRSLHMIKAYAKERYMRRRYEQGLLENFATIDRVNFYDSVFSAVITTLKSLLIATVVVLSSDKTGFLGITIGMLAASIDLVSDLFRPIDALGMEMEQIQKGLSGIAGIDNFLASEEEPAKDERLALQTILPISQAGLTFSHVSFRYPDGEEEVFHNLDFSIAAGSHIAFVGRTGIGKSTLFRLVLGLLPHARENPFERYRRDHHSYKAKTTYLRICRSEFRTGGRRHHRPSRSPRCVCLRKRLQKRTDIRGTR